MFQLSEISQNGVYPRTECIDVLDSNDGDVPKALIALEKKSMQPMLQRVLDSCLPDDSPDEQVVFGSHILGHHAPQDTGMFDAAVRDSGQNIDVSSLQNYSTHKSIRSHNCQCS